MSGWFDNVRTSRKLLLAFLIIGTAGMVQFAIGLRSLFEMGDALRVSNVERNEIMKLYEAQTETLKLAIAENEYLLERSPAALEASDRSAAAARSALEELRDLVDSEDEAEAADQVKRKIGENRRAFKELVARSAGGAPDPGAIAKQVERHGQIGHVLQNLVADAVEEIEDAQREAVAEASATTMLGIGLAVGCLILGIGLSLLLAHGITQPLAEFRAAAERISLGDTNVKVATGRKDEIGELADSFDRMVTAVRFLVLEAAEKDRGEKGA